MNYIRIYKTGIQFWSNDGEDYPNEKLFRDQVDNPSNYTEYKTKDLTINWDTDQTAKITIPLEKGVDFPTYLSLHINNKRTRYYSATSIYMETNTSTTYNLTLDTWGTFCIPIVYSLNYFQPPLTTTRNHILNPRAYQLTDTLLNSIPLTFDRKNNVSQTFPFTETGAKITNTLPPTDTEANREVITDKNSLINGTAYYAFSGDGKSDTTNYYFVPVLAQSAGTIEYKYSKTVNVLANTIEVNANVWDADAQQALYEKYVKAGQVPKQMAPYMSTDTQPREITTQYTTTCTPHTGPRWVRYTVQSIYKNGEQVYYKQDIKYGSTCPAPYPPEPIKWEFYTQTISPIVNTYSIHNNADQVGALLSKTELINKFKGVFFMPNFINFSNDLTRGPAGHSFENMFFIKMPATGIPLNINLPWYSAKNVIPTEWNSTEIENLQVKSFENYSYYQNSKSWGDYTDTFDLNLSGLFIFNGAGSFFPTSSRLKSVDAAINYPYQLPSATDGYIEYYSRNLSSVNNGINQQKIQYDLSKDRLIGGAVFGAAGIASNAKPDVSTALSAGSFAFNTAMSSRDLERQNQSYYKGLAAQYEDVQRNTGANFNTSNVNDSTNIIVQLNTPYHAEVMEKMDLNVENIKVLNNVLFLYGNLNVGTYDWRTLTTQHTNFNYIKLNEIDLFSQFTNYTVVYEIPRNYIRMLVSFFAKGFRIHNNTYSIPSSAEWGPNPLKTSLLRDANGQDSK